jgi:ATP phosphoribosyltransferase regulatory subunit
VSTRISLPSGVRDFLPAAAARRRRLADLAIATFEAWGYDRIITPVFEHADVLARGLGDDADRAAIRFVEPGSGEVVALRPDITPQIARVVATRLADVEPPIRLCYEGSVTRRVAERGQREILQAGIELVGAPAPAGDAEVLAVAAAALAAAGVREPRLDVGHVAPARHVLAAAPAERRAAVLAALARKDRAGVAAAARGTPVAALADALVGLWGPAQATLDRARALPWPDDVRAALGELADVLAALAELAPDAPPVSLDLGDVRGNAYYTGVHFAGYAAGAPDAVLRGGRYDELIARYGRSARATGFAIDLELVAQSHGDDAPPLPRGLALAGARAAALARTLRAAGTRAVVATAASPVTAAWLRDAGFAAALDLATGIATLPDGSSRDAADAIAAAARGDTRALVALASG